MLQVIYFHLCYYFIFAVIRKKNIHLQKWISGMHVESFGKKIYYSSKREFTSQKHLFFYTKEEHYVRHGKLVFNLVEMRFQ